MATHFAAGQTITTPMSCITNNGAAPGDFINDITVTTPGRGSQLPDECLAAGASMTCTGNYITTVA